MIVRVTECRLHDRAREAPKSPRPPGGNRDLPENVPRTSPFSDQRWLRREPGRQRGLPTFLPGVQFRVPEESVTASLEGARIDRLFHRGKGFHPEPPLCVLAFG